MQRTPVAAASFSVDERSAALPAQCRRHLQASGFRPSIAGQQAGHTIMRAGQTYKESYHGASGGCIAPGRSWRAGRVGT